MPLAKRRMVFMYGNCVLYCLAFTTAAPKAVDWPLQAFAAVGVVLQICANVIPPVVTVFQTWPANGWLSSCRPSSLTPWLPTYARSRTKLFAMACSIDRVHVSTYGVLRLG